MLRAHEGTSTAMPDSVEQRLGTTLCTYRGHSSWLEAVAWSPDSTRIASGAWDRTVQVWDASSGETIASYGGHSKIIQAVAWSPDGTRIASTDQSYPGRVQVWDARTGEEIIAFYGDTAFVSDLAWSPDGTRIASTGSMFERLVHVWDAQTGEALLTYRDHPSAVCKVAWSPNSARIVSASREPDGTIQIWDASSGETLLTLRQEKNWTGACAVAWSPNGKRIAAATSGTARVEVWEASRGRHVATSLHGASAIAWSADSQRLASATSITNPREYLSDDDYDGPPPDSLTWKMMGGEKAWKKYVERQLQDPRRLHNKTCIARETKVRGSAVLVWDAASGDDLFICAPHADAIKAVAWSPDGTRIASASVDRTVQVCQAR